MSMELNKIYNVSAGCLLNMIGKEIRLGYDRKFCIVTDPPFNVGYHYNEYKDKMDDDEYYERIGELLTYLGCPFVVIHYPESLYKISFQTGYFPEKVISRVYNSNTAKQHRDIAYFGIKPDMNQVKQPYKNPSDKRIQKRIKEGKTGARLYDWRDINQVKNVSKKKINHPCVMPLEVMKRCIGILPKDTVIIDLFMGSGTTALACKELGYDFIGCEISKEYTDIANERILSCNKNEGVM